MPRRVCLLPFLPIVCVGLNFNSLLLLDDDGRISPLAIGSTVEAPSVPPRTGKTENQTTQGLSYLESSSIIGMGYAFI